MRKIVAFFIRYPVWTNVLMMSIFIFGTISFLNMKKSFFPEREPSFINITVAYPGASPEEVEEGIVLKIEENLDGLDDVERVTSTSRENFGQVVVEVMEDADVDKVLTDVKNAVDRINSFPRDSEKPVVFKQKYRSAAVSIIIFGETDLFNLKQIAEGFRDQLLATPEISQVSINGLPDLEIAIEVSEASMQRYQLTFNEISNAVSQANVNISGGKFDTEAEEILIRAYGRNYYARELENIPLRGNADGTVVYLKDVAAIEERWEDVPNKSYYNGRVAVVVQVDQAISEDILEVADRALLEMDSFNAENDQVEALVLSDQTTGLRQRLDLIYANGIIGLMLVVLTLGFFLNLRLSFWTSIGIPLSFAGMFIVASFVGITINVISTFGMVIVVGILVDDAIVVGENIFAHFERGKDALTAAIDGTMEVLGPVFTSVTTTIIAFTPYFFLDGEIGKFIWHMALVVIASLAFSLIEAFFVLPAHLAHSKGLSKEKKVSRLRQRIEGGIKAFTDQIYAPALKKVIHYKWISISAPWALFMITIGLVAGGIIKFTPFPFIDGDTIPVNVSLVTGRQEADTDSLLAKIERAVWDVNEDLKKERPDGKDVILGIKRDIGSNSLGESGSHAGQLTIKLLNGEIRDMDSFLISNRIRSAVGPLPDAQKLAFGRQGFFGKDVSLSLLGSDLDQLNLARNMLVDELSNLPSLKDITDSNVEGRREVKIQLKPQAYALGLTLREVAGQVRQGFFGQEVQRIQRGRDEIRVWVRYRSEDRGALGFLDQMRIRTSDGAEYPFGSLAGYTIDRGITSINRLNQKREIRVEASRANVSDPLPPILAEIRQNIMPGVLSRVEGVTVLYEGQSRGQQKFQRSLQRAFPIAMICMFIMLVLVFRSWLQAGLIFTLIPLGIMCAIWGHGIMDIFTGDMKLNNLSIYGIIALTGIIINDSIVLVDQINRNLRNKMSVFDAVFNGAISRLRPIVLTSLTTAFGLAPIILETSRQAQFLIPMAVSVAFGIFFGTFILLLVLPAGYLALNSIRFRLTSWLRKSEKITREAVEPAVKELDTPALN